MNKSAAHPVRPVPGYQIEGVVGRGRRSTVYLARQRAGNRAVALKVAGSDLARECAAMAALAHPNVVRVLGAGTADGRAWVAMEYAAGGSMASQRGAPGWARIACLMTEAARALAWVHRNGWVHRDIKPANLLVRGDGSIALTDFGCACPRDEVDTVPAGTVIGTPRYAAPEQSQGAPADATADVYSLGVCLYEMLTGAPPFPGETLTELLGQHLLAPVPPLPLDAAMWQPLLDAMLAKDPRERPADGEAVLARLQQVEHSLWPGDGSPSHDSRNLP